MNDPSFLPALKSAKNKRRLVILGAFFADLACLTPRMPEWGETLHGLDFSIGPGGKGSNQAVSAARLGAEVQLISRLGRDPFGDLARKVFKQEGILSRFVKEDEQEPTGTATILLENNSSEHAIIIVPGACGKMDRSDVDVASNAIGDAQLFLSQLEIPSDTCFAAIEVAYERNVPILLNPAPAMRIPDEIYPKIDYITPNESEVTRLTGLPLKDKGDAKFAAHTLRDWGVSNVLITLGKQGVYVSGKEGEGMVASVDAGPLVDTTGAGDAFNAGFANALVEHYSLLDAARFGCTVAGLSVTRHGTALSMPHRKEVDNLLMRGT